MAYELVYAPTQSRPNRDGWKIYRRAHDLVLSPARFTDPERSGDGPMVVDQQAPLEAALVMGGAAPAVVYACAVHLSSARVDRSVWLDADATRTLIALTGQQVKCRPEVAQLIKELQSALGAPTNLGEHEDEQSVAGQMRQSFSA